MILRRLGNKSAIAKEIQKHFPPHKIYIEPSEKVRYIDRFMSSCERTVAYN